MNEKTDPVKHVAIIDFLGGLGQWRSVYKLETALYGSARPFLRLCSNNMLDYKNCDPK